MNKWYYCLISVKDNSVLVSNPYPFNFSMGVLCDKARELSLENNNLIVNIYKFFCEKPMNTRLLYRFINGKLVRY